MDRVSEQTFSLALTPHEVRILRDWASEVLGEGDGFPTDPHLRVMDQFGRELRVNVLEPDDDEFR
jgi:hypothetical protein